MVKVLKSVWPLALSVLALAGMIHLIPEMYWDLQFARHGVWVRGWYTDLNQDNDTFRYAYKVGEAIFGGEAPWNDADSGIYTSKPGDDCGEVLSLPTKPWRSRYRRAPEQDLYWDKVWMGWGLAGFFLG